MSQERCDVCGVVLVAGEICRLLMDSAENRYYGHVECIAEVEAIYLRSGAQYLGDIRARHRGP